MPLWSEIKANEIIHASFHPNELLPRLVGEFGFSLAILPWSPKSEAQIVAEQLAWARLVVREAFAVWWRTGVIMDTVVAGVSLRELMAQEGEFRPIRAFVRLARLARQESDDLVTIGLRKDSFRRQADECRISVGFPLQDAYLIRHLAAVPGVKYERYNVDGPSVTILEIDPPYGAIEALWDLIEAVGIWSWPARSAVWDGNENALVWSLALQRNGRQLLASGHGVIPDVESFNLLSEGIRALMGPDVLWPRIHGAIGSSGVDLASFKP